MFSKNDVSTKELVLSTIGVVGILSIALLAPNALQMLKVFGLNPKKIHSDRIFKSQLGATAKRLMGQGLLTKRDKGGYPYLHLTKKGERELLRYKLKRSARDKNKKWDRKWRVIIFDIREERKKVRDLLRYELKQFGFMRLQHSVWVYPYECEDFITLLKADLAFGKSVLYMIVERVEEDEHLRQSFRLM